ncbi:golgin subfamily A member 6-like protein 2 [Chenopodium quinoa]|uniref:golgin subfamily A member 6-like protein 2 n=1 Tax=Chenopodium quinoa TaxID=63459 RepID=UPI000B78C553|nr:golgin subfamily A member 6-like protein 2 [Chenopodium quinoa]
MADVKFENFVFELERLGCLGFLLSLFLSIYFPSLHLFTAIVQLIVGVIFIVTNINILINFILPETTSEASSKDEKLKQMQIYVDELIMEKKMWGMEKQKLMKQVSEEKQKLTEQVTMEKKMREEEKQKLKEQSTTEKKMWEEEKLSLTEQVEEARARIELYTYEMIYLKKLSKLEEQVKNMEEEREEFMKKNLVNGDGKEKDKDKEKLEEKCRKLNKEKKELSKVVEEYKVYEQNVGEEFKIYQQNWEFERNNLKSQIDHLFNVIAKYDELNNRQQYMIVLLSGFTDQYRHNAAYQSTEETSDMSPDY